jgi:putative hemolysin
LGGRLFVGGESDRLVDAFGRHRDNHLLCCSCFIVGDLPTEPGEEPLIVRRDDGSWLMDGGLDLDTVLRTIDTESLLSDDEGQHYHTLGGLAMAALGRVPRTGDVFERRGYRFEVVDMDGNRVDRVLVSQTSPTSGSGPAASPRQQG